MRKFYIVSALTIALGASITGCDYNNPEHYDPAAGFRNFVEERERKADAPQAVDAASDPAEEVLAEARQLYNTFCSTCHGPDGRGDTATARALNPRPRDFSETSWQEATSDEHIIAVIRDGGPAVGLSPVMAPWGGALSEQQIEDMVQVVREFAR